MNKIFKYTIAPNGRVYMPKDHTLLRVDYVDDGFYKGNFVWAIVDSEDQDMEHIKLDCIEYDSYQTVTDPTVHEYMIRIHTYSLSPKPELLECYDKTQLAVKEKQTVELDGKPEFAEDDNGMMYIYSRKDNRWGHTNPYKIAVYKTGQEIIEPLDKLQYLGLNKLWIMQELGLYTFLVKD